MWQPSPTWLCIASEPKLEFKKKGVIFAKNIHQIRVAHQSKQYLLPCTSLSIGRVISSSIKGKVFNLLDKKFWKSNQLLELWNSHPRETLEGQIRQASWSSFTKKATSALAEDEKQLLRQREILQQPVAKRGFETILASLSTINGTLGNALEGGYNYKETKATNKRSQNAVNELDNQGCRVSNVKSSHDISMTMEMASRIQLLVKEISTLKTELSLVKHQCRQLEEENMRLHENKRREVKPEDDDLVNQQLEALLLEKSRLAQENANYARENQVLTEIIDYHRLALQDILSNESIGDAEAAT